MDEIKYINEKDVARISGFSLSSIRNKRFNGVGIPYRKIGRSVLYRYNEVIEYIESKKVTTIDD